MLLMRALGVVLLLVPHPGCGSADPAPGPTGAEGGKADVAGGETEGLAWCAGHEHEATPSGMWDHAPNGLWTAAAPHHTAQDVVGAPGGAVTVRGKFSYGALAKDLEDESVQVWLGDCDGFRLVADARTDDQGRIAVEVDTGLPVGVYDLSLEVAVDGTAARAKLWLLPEGTHAVVTDIDGTLTTSDGELVADIVSDFFEPILAGDYVPEAYPGGPELLRAHADDGAILVYLTGRPHSLTDTTREWLAERGFPAGILHTTDHNAEVMPTDGGVGDFKHRYLDSLRAGGLVLDLAYGNARTDIHGYAAAGIPAASTWIIGAHAGEEGTSAVDGSWEARAAEVEAQPAVVQPFSD